MREFCTNECNVLNPFVFCEEKRTVLSSAEMYVWLVTVSCETSSEEMLLRTHGEGGRAALTQAAEAEFICSGM